MPCIPNNNNDDDDEPRKQYVCVFSVSQYIWLVCVFVMDAFGILDGVSFVVKREN